MRKFWMVAALTAGSFGLAAPAMAGPGQCYDAYGRPVGPVYDTDHPNYAFLNSVTRRGGTCGRIGSQPNRRGYQAPNYRPHPGYQQPNYGYPRQGYQGYPRYQGYPSGRYDRYNGYDYSR